ncbi:MAG: SPOR domain-containing protein [Glaciecola sp.]|uniref:SPOR domain-containing protein n=1 Tax=Glaciecola sp. HTCC2999 TaxID=455436 RepID=UPI0000E0E89D|nr:SPOR domain-containing protein [Glaciecola sp. HTCC2999]
MNTALQNRLVGTILVVALAVIFLPDLLDGQKQVQQDIQINIPKPPAPLATHSLREVNIENIKQQAALPVVVEDIIADDTDVVSVSDTGIGTNTDTQVTPEIDTAVATSPPENSKTNLTASLENQTQRLQADPQESAGWVIQLGSFRHQKNVRELFDILEKAGYRTFSRPVETPSGILTKVFVGPEIDQEKLKAALPHLNEITKLKGRLTPFTI